MKKLIIANWKMHPDTVAMASRLANEVGRAVNGVKKTEVVLAPPFIFLPVVRGVQRRNSVFRLGAQDVFGGFVGENLPHTGEISIKQLKHIGVKYVIVGHSERRTLGETDKIVHKKLKMVLGNGLTAVLCVGEKDKKGGLVFPAIIRDELHFALKKIKKGVLKNLIVAYEPIWAIGSGKADTPQDVYEMTLLIRRELYRILGKRFAKSVRVIYGGSVDEKNAGELLKKGAVDGFLVGGASLNPKKFVKIVKETENL